MSFSRSDLPSDLLVKAWMNPPDHRVTPNDTVEDALGIMRAANVRHLLVMEDDELCGVVTDRDLQRPDYQDGRPLEVEELYLIGQDLRVRDVMSEEVITIEADAPTARAAQLMVDNKFNCLPVVRDDALVGILTSSDLLAALVHIVDPDLFEG
ncbi:MAG: CBS domain-containing protein [Deltaproteobacteria bacterium]|jgi:acetoin utilization protein AcuB|nr:CBS domain-containing protein [Deltaproteobacteria bacterium]MBW2535504.1 CBS domain-containing protein [Deltaproteobacteria bacterium]